jgi:hypothetical protein
MIPEDFAQYLRIILRDHETSPYGLPSVSSQVPQQPRQPQQTPHQASGRVRPAMKVVLV